MGRGLGRVPGGSVMCRVQLTQGSRPNFLVIVSPGSRVHSSTTFTGNSRLTKVSTTYTANKTRLRFTIRTALLAMVFVALVFGWYSSSERARRKNIRLSKRLLNLKAELESQSWRSEPNDERINRKAEHKGILSNAQFSRVNMQGVSISGEFQSAEFESCILQDAKLSGGTSSFQFAKFNSCNLINAKLTGGGSAFQMSSFENSDLSGAVLIGGGTSFQRATFRGAKLIGTKIICPAGSAAFQMVNIDSVQFQGADLSAIDYRALESCFFDTPPSYNNSTQFPSGFDPAAQLWIREP